MPAHEEKLSEKDRKSIERMCDLAVARSLLMLKEPGQAETLVAPFTLFASPFPRALYEESLRLQEVWNRLIYSLSRDTCFLDNMVARLQGMDDFVDRLSGIEHGLRDWILATPALALVRSDYLLHNPTAPSPCPLADCQLKQVEINTIASSFAGLSALLGEIRSATQPSASVPHNSSLDLVVDALAKSVQHFNAKHSIAESKSIIVVQPLERNLYDQSCITQGLASRHGIEMIRLTLAEASSRLCLEPASKCLRLDGSPISLVYYRAGYVPQDYPTETEWQARVMLEASTAIKCPSVSAQLVGMKKTQQMLAEGGVLERYVADPHDRERLRKSFMGLYALDSATPGTPFVETALANPDHYVLKPQREGGGNNMTGAPMAAFIEAHRAELPAYILMDKITSPSFPNVLVRQGVPMVAESVSELGIYGAILWDHTGPRFSASAGYLLRTKTKETSEGGVAAGFAYLDTPDLQ